MFLPPRHLEFNPPNSETEEKDMENVVDTLAGLQYEQLGEETQLLAKKAHVAIPSQIRLLQLGAPRLNPWMRGNGRQRWRKN